MDREGEEMATKHELILRYIKELPVGEKEFGPSSSAYA